jgi:hypothetical protein
MLLSSSGHHPMTVEVKGIFSNGIYNINPVAGKNILSLESYRPKSRQAAKRILTKLN